MDIGVIEKGNFHKNKEIFSMGKSRKEVFDCFLETLSRRTLFLDITSRKRVAFVKNTTFFVVNFDVVVVDRMPHNMRCHYTQRIVVENTL